MDCSGHSTRETTPKAKAYSTLSPNLTLLQPSIQRAGGLFRLLRQVTDELMRENRFDS